MLIRFACLLFSALLLLANSSCQKEFSIESGNTPGGTVLANNSADTIYIERIVRTKYNGTNYDTVMITQFTYDSLRRMKGWRDYPVLAGYGYPESMEYGYKGTDTLPSTARYTTKATGSADSVIQDYYFYYDDLTRKIKDSVHKINTVAPQHSGWVDHFYYLPGKSVTVGRYEDPNTVYLYRDTSVLDAGNNLVEAKFYSGPSQDYTMHCNFQFDNGNHIFSKCNVRNAVPKSIVGTLAHKYSGSNNILYQKIDYFTTYIEVSNTITYNRYNFPATIEGMYNNEQLKMFFYYRSLQ
ncbi:MAG: hypothetical protein QM687_14070 [Ferruginibacter sp.]